MNPTRLRQAARAITALAVIASTAVGVIHAACWDTSTPPKPFSLYSFSGPAGTVVDTATNLMWKSCVEGQNLSSFCAGAGSLMNWAAGQSIAAASTHGGYNDWRMPSLIELQSLLATGCPSPQINTSVFANTPANSYTWTGQTSATDSALAFFMFFANGSAGPVNKVSGSGVVRLVRGVQYLNPLLTNSQTLAFGAAPTLTLGSSPTVNAASNGGGANSGNAIAYSGSPAIVCAVNASTGQISLTGTATIGDACIVAANQLGSIAHNQSFAPAAQVTLSVPVSKSQQTVAFDAVPVMHVGDQNLLSATSNQGITPVEFGTDTPSVCSLSGAGASTVLTGVTSGTCNIAAYAPSNARYLQAKVTQSFGIGLARQILSFGAAPLVNVGGTGLVTATSNLGLPPVLSSTTLPVCTIIGNTVSGVANGLCTIHATQGGNANTASAVADLSFSVSPTTVVCNLHMDGTNPMLATKEGLILTRAMLGLKGSAVTAGTGITTPWDTIRVDLNAKCGTAFLP